MTPEQWQKISEIYHAATEIDRAEIPAFLDKKCDGDESLRREVESLLAADREAGSFISEPIAGHFASRLLKSSTFSPDDTLGHYRILSKIGNGGMGEVFLAADIKLGRRVALKTLSSLFQGDETFLKRFRNEARAAASLNHPHVATVYSVDEVDGHTFIAMEYIEGKTLEELIPDDGVDIATFIRWFVPIAEALEHAHARGIVHRDVKPGNIMVANDGVVKILDFGLAYCLPSNEVGNTSFSDLTHPGQVLGTPSYMSPEQAKGEEVDRRSDIFSLGVVMFEAATGERPFQGDSHAEVVSNILKTEPSTPQAIKTDVPQEISDLISRCLRKKRRDRPQSMSDVRKVLRGTAGSSLGSSSQWSLSQRFYRQMQSNSKGVNLVLAGVVLLLAAAGWFYFSREPEQPPINFTNMTIRRLSRSNNVVYSVITPDGKSLVYNTIEEGSTRALWIRRIDDRNALRLTEPQPVEFWGGLAVNSDVSQIFYITAARGAAGGTLYRISSLGGTPRKLAESVNDLGSLSPDGKQFLFVRYLDQMRILRANSEDGSGETVIKEFDKVSTLIRDPHYSPDGRWIYYLRMDRADNSQSWTLVKIPAEGGEETVVVPKGSPRMFELAVLSDGSGLVFTQTDPLTTLFQIYYVSAEGGEPVRITNDLNSYFGVSVDRAGRSIVAAQRYDEKRIWVGDASLADTRAVTPEANVQRYVEWTPDGRIVYDAVEDKFQQIWIADADGKNAQQLTLSQASNFAPKVSGDGKYIVFTSSRSGREQVWRMNIDGSNQVLLVDDPGSSNAVRIAPDGETIYFNWNRDGRQVMGRINVGGGEITEMTKFSEGDWTFSPDGSRVAYSIRDTQTGKFALAVRRIDSEAPELLIDSAPVYLIEWRPDGKAIYVREREAGPSPFSTILEYDLATSKNRVALSTEPDHVYDLSFSLDGGRAAIIRGRLITDAVMFSATDTK